MRTFETEINLGDKFGTNGHLSVIDPNISQPQIDKLEKLYKSVEHVLKDCQIEPLGKQKASALAMYRSIYGPTTSAIRLKKTERAAMFKIAAA